MKNKNHYWFLRGFMDGIGADSMTEAQEQWGGWSRQLSDMEIARIMDGGYEKGWTEAQSYLGLYVEQEVL